MPTAARRSTIAANYAHRPGRSTATPFSPAQAEAARVARTRKLRGGPISAGILAHAASGAAEGASPRSSSPQSFTTSAAHPGTETRKPSSLLQQARGSELAQKLGCHLARQLSPRVVVCCSSLRRSHAFSRWATRSGSRSTASAAPDPKDRRRAVRAARADYVRGVARPGARAGAARCPERVTRQPAGEPPAGLRAASLVQQHVGQPEVGLRVAGIVSQDIAQRLLERQASQLPGRNQREPREQLAAILGSGADAVERSPDA